MNKKIENKMFKILKNMEYETNKLQKLIEEKPAYLAKELCKLDDLLEIIKILENIEK